MIRILYFGLPLAALLLAGDGFRPSFAVLSPVDAPGRRRLRKRLGPRVIEARALPERRLLERVELELAAAPPDLIVSWYWTRRLPARWLAAARLGAIGAHPSLLPRHRGPNPFFWAIDAGDPVTGVTVHRLTEEYDAGDVLLEETVPVGERNAWQLARALDRPSLRLLRRAVRALAEGPGLAGTAQDERRVTAAPEPVGDLLRVDWRWPTDRVLRRIRALSPVPGLALDVRGVELFVTRAERAAVFPSALLPGEAGVLPEGVVVRTGDGAVLLARAALAASDAEVDARALAALLGGRP